jgi:hypothetical protein
MIRKTIDTNGAFNRADGFVFIVLLFFFVTG